MTNPTEVEQTLPLYAAKAVAGFPGAAHEEIEEMLDLHELLISHPESTFFVRVSGDSMQDAGVFSDDILIVDRGVEPRSGSIVVAAFAGGLVVKRLIGKQGDYSLLSANDDFAPIKISEYDDCHIWGVVTGSVRKFKN